MKYRMLLSICLFFVFGLANAQKINANKVIADAEKQTRVMFAEINIAKAAKPELVSPRTVEKAELKLVPSKDWTSGFFPGIPFSIDFNGNWSYTATATNFSLFLTQNGATLTGSHCSSMFNGGKLDCRLDPSDLSITATTVSNPTIVTVYFKSYFSGTTGRATIRKISDTQIEWIILDKPSGDFFLPPNVTLTKR